MTLILVVDDDAAVSQVLSEIVTTYGYEVLVAGSAKEAASLVASKPVDTIFLDISMPGITGDQFLGFIRKRGFKIPVVVVSAHVDTEMEKKLTEIGVSGILRKPFEVAEVIDEMEKALESKKNLR